MKEKELSKLSRLELLEMLIEQSKEVERLSIELNQAKQELEKREIILNQAGSIAEASLQLSGIFEAAQEAANQYLYNIKKINDSYEKNSQQIETESIRKAHEMLIQTKEDCEFMKEETMRQCKQAIKEAKQEIENEWLTFNRYKQLMMRKK